MNVDDPSVVCGIVRRFGPADLRPNAAAGQTLAQAIMLSSDVDGMKQAALDGDEQNGDDMRFNLLGGERQALAGKPDPIEARASRTEKLLAPRATVASEYPSPESRKAAESR
jgi:hypothetical protein